MKLRKEVCLAAEDYRYLLDRGYGQKVSLDLVTSRYLLTKEERTLLLRCIHRSDEAEAIRRKLVKEVFGEGLVIDGYNVILTIVSLLEGRDLYLCDDCIVRDLRSSYIKDFSTPVIYEAVKILRHELLAKQPSRTVIVLDKNVSWSARHAEILRAEIPNAEVRLAKKADLEVLATELTVASSDFVILQRARRIYDLAGNVAKRLSPQSIVRIDELIIKNPCGDC